MRLLLKLLSMLRRSQYYYSFKMIHCYMRRLTNHLSRLSLYVSFLFCKFYLIKSPYKRCYLVYITADSGVISIHSPDIILEGDMIPLFYEMRYYSGGVAENLAPMANVTWSGDNCRFGTQFSNSTYVASWASVLAQSPLLQVCICTQFFNAPQQPQIGYAVNAPTYTSTWSSPTDISVSCTPIVSLSVFLSLYILVFCSLNTESSVDIEPHLV